MTEKTFYSNLIAKILATFDFDEARLLMLKNNIKWKNCTTPVPSTYIMINKASEMLKTAIDEYAENNLNQFYKFENLIVTVGQNSNKEFKLELNLVLI